MRPRVATALMACTGVCLVAVSTLGPLPRLIAIAAAVLVLAIVALGPDRLGFLFMSAAFVTAPMYKGLAASPSSQVTPTDLLIAAGFLLLVLRAVQRRLYMPVDYAVSVTLLMIFAALSGLLAQDPATAFQSQALWFIAMVVLPLGLAALQLSRREVRILAWCYVGGQMFDSVWAATHDGGRWQGLSTHPNFFGEYAVLAIGLLLFLAEELPPSRRWIAWGCLAVCGLDVIESGSRAALIGSCILALAYPVIERTTRAAYAFAIGCTTVLAVLSQVSLHASENSAIGRLLGGGSASGSDIERTNGLTGGWSQFWQHPLLGSGLNPDRLFDIHNDLLEVAVATGTLGFLAYLGVLASFGRVLMFKGSEHRLGYAPLAFFVIAATSPALWDRSTWCTMALALVAYGFQRHRLEAEDQDTAALGPGSRAEGSGQRLRVATDLASRDARHDGA